MQIDETNSLYLFEQQHQVLKVLRELTFKHLEFSLTLNFHPINLQLTLKFVARVEYFTH